jgi:hypothetical protein
MPTPINPSSLLCGHDQIRIRAPVRRQLLSCFVLGYQTTGSDQRGRRIELIESYLVDSNRHLGLSL